MKITSNFVKKLACFSDDAAVALVLFHQDCRLGSFVSLALLFGFVVQWLRANVDFLDVGVRFN